MDSRGVVMVVSSLFPVDTLQLTIILIYLLLLIKQQIYLLIIYLHIVMTLFACLQFLILWIFSTVSIWVPCRTSLYLYLLQLLLDMYIICILLVWHISLDYDIVRIIIWRFTAKELLLSVMVWSFKLLFGGRAFRSGLLLHT